jgi:hypothetical protein
VIRNGYKVFDNDMTVDQLNEEMLSCEWDKKAWMRGRVVNKEGQDIIWYFRIRHKEPDYEEKKR